MAFRREKEREGAELGRKEKKEKEPFSDSLS